MKRLIGSAAGIDYFQRERNLPTDAILSSGNGLFSDEVPPNEFAVRVVNIVRAEGDEGFVYEGQLNFEEQSIKLESLPDIPVKIMMNIANP